jgi:KDO2-lipid IV(A) lauroyltransferase
MAQKLKLKLHLISKTFKSKWLNDFWFSVRRQKGMQFIEPHGKEASFRILRALREKSGVIFVMDQFMGKPYGVETTFFEHSTGTAYGLALFAMKTEVPVVPVFTFRDSEGRTVIKAEPPLPFENFGDREITIQKMTQKYNNKLEEIVRRHPEQWMWVHRRWKKFE